MDHISNIKYLQRSMSLCNAQNIIIKLQIPVYTWKNKKKLGTWNKVKCYAKIIYNLNTTLLVLWEWRMDF
jgi:hypothetical protein